MNWSEFHERKTARDTVRGLKFYHVHVHDTATKEHSMERFTTWIDATRYMTDRVDQTHLVMSGPHFGQAQCALCKQHRPRTLSASELAIARARRVLAEAKRA